MRMLRDIVVLSVYLSAIAWILMPRWKRELFLRRIEKHLSKMPPKEEEPYRFSAEQLKIIDDFRKAVSEWRG